MFTTTRRKGRRAPAHPALPWAKLGHDDERTVVAALPLAEHALDVAACGEALLAGGAWGRALEATAGRTLTALDLIPTGEEARAA